MAQYFHLNIYKTALDLLIMVTNLTSKFNRNYRFTVGEKLQNSNIEFIVCIYKANSAQKENERMLYLKELMEKLQFLNVYIRLSCEIKAISKEQYINLTKYTQDIERQLNGWFSYNCNRMKAVNEQL